MTDKALAEYRSAKAREERWEKMERVQDEVFASAAGIMQAFMAFAEIEPDQQEPPEEWIAEFGPKGAALRLKVAKLGWGRKDEMPGGVAVAEKVYTGINKARQKSQRATQAPLNVTISLPAPTSAEHPGGETYPVRELE